ncbi:hypothetical protein AWJ20_1067 [Sugiyamaella lignohabitans]|uniref:Uncharacterized protein n=1 Tax=Sugiyamaella lignohabitans TaxID=796027 RepID=A0A167DDM6_9ASCO|nr:uncharacterized protein AWJ20_1067 [Sugiyamaella lignohabitans]ANB12795.1 hypothetical protein AWJ20_1067 [Sugiyamaella lignohabitans]
MYFINSVLILLFACQAYAASTVPPLPTEDSFYTTPSGFEQQPLGAILKTRPIPGSLGFLIDPEKAKASYQFMYRTEDALGNPIAAISTIIGKLM